MAETMKEAIADKEAEQEPERKIYMVQFSHKIHFNDGPGRKVIERYDGAKPEWREWNVEGSPGGLSFRKGRRLIEVPRSQCVTETRDACPRCGTFLKLTGLGHCPSESCTWPKAEIHHCPECKSQLKENATACPNADCRWGWKDPDGDEPVMPKDTRAKITGKCEQCDSQIRDGKCPLGCDVMREPKPDTLLTQGKERDQWPTKEA